MVQDSIRLFFRGKLFANPQKAYRQLAIGISVTTLLFVVCAKFLMPIWTAAFVSGLVGGALQPFLFKDLRYR